MRTSLRRSLEELGLFDRIVSRSPARTPREIPKSFHLPARLVTAEITSRRSSSSANRTHSGSRQFVLKADTPIRDLVNFVILTKDFCKQHLLLFEPHPEHFRNYIVHFMNDLSVFFTNDPM